MMPDINSERGSSTVAVLVGFAVMGTMVYLNSEYLKSDLEIERKVRERQELLGLFRTLDDGLDCAATLEGVATLNCSEINSMNNGLGPLPKTSKKIALASGTATGFNLGGRIMKLECSAPTGGGRHGLHVKVFDNQQGFVEKQGSKVHCSFVANSLLNSSAGVSAGGGSVSQGGCNGSNEIYSPEIATCIPVVAPENYDQLFISSAEIQSAQSQYQQALMGSQGGGYSTAPSTEPPPSTPSVSPDVQNPTASEK